MNGSGSDGDTQHNDDLPSIDDLRACEEATRESRKRCRESVNAAIACGEAIADVITRRLKTFAEQTPRPPEKIAQQASDAQAVMRAWMKPLQAAQGLIVAVGMDHLAAEGRTAVATLALQQVLAKTMVPDPVVRSLVSRLAGAETPEQKVAIILDLRDEDLHALRGLGAAQEARRKKLDMLVGRAAVIQAEVAGTYVAILEYIVARQLYLMGFIEVTQYADDAPEIEKLGSEQLMPSVVKAGTVALDVLVTKVGPKVLQQIPIVGIVAGAVDVVRDMRRERQAFRDRTALIQERNEARMGRNFTWELADLERDLEEDAKKLEKLHTLVDQLGKLLRQVDHERENRGRFSCAGHQEIRA